MASRPLACPCPRCVTAPRSITVAMSCPPAVPLPLLHAPRPSHPVPMGLCPRTSVRYDAPAQGRDRPVRLCVVDIGKDRVYAVGLLEHSQNIP